MADDTRDIARLKGGIAGLKYLVDELRSGTNERFDDLRDALRDIATKQQSLGERLAAVEARSTDLRDEVTARHRSVSPKDDASLVKASPASQHVPTHPQPRDTALETLKAIGPWIIAGLSLIGTLVNALLGAAAH